MRPIAKRQNALRYPLNSILGTEANVRVLRAISSSSSRNGRSYRDLVGETGLSDPGLRRSVASLEKAGLVDVSGVSGRQVSFRQQHPLSKVLAALFRAEANTWRKQIDALRAVFAGVRPAPISAWIEAPVGASRGPAGRIVVSILARAADIDTIREAVEPAIAEIETGHDLMVELRSLTRPDLETLTQAARDRAARGTPVFGPAPEDLLKQPRSRVGSRKRAGHTHADHDARSLALGAAIAEAVRRDPSLIQKARSFVAERSQRASASERHELREWERVLRASPAKVRALLADPGERATRLRQTQPFLEALSAEERASILESLDDVESTDDP